MKSVRTCEIYSIIWKNPGHKNNVWSLLLRVLDVKPTQIFIFFFKLWISISFSTTEKKLNKLLFEPHLRIFFEVSSTTKNNIISLKSCVDSCFEKTVIRSITFVKHQAIIFLKLRWIVKIASPKDFLGSIINNKKQHHFFGISCWFLLWKVFYNTVYLC